MGLRYPQDHAQQKQQGGPASCPPTKLERRGGSRDLRMTLGTPCCPPPAQWWMELHSASPGPKQLNNSGQVCGLLTAVYIDCVLGKEQMDF